MIFVVGVVLFALGIAASVALHECGHMWAAKGTGMIVRRYFVGFGPKIFSWRRGETEYGLKAIPAGGFCDIAGMTIHDELEPEEIGRAMYRQKTWKRLLVMFAGIAMNFALGLLLIFILAVTWGLPNNNSNDAKAQVGTLGCAAATQSPDGTLAACTGAGPGETAGIKTGDIITAVNGVPTPTSTDVVKQTQDAKGTAQFSITRDGHDLTIPVQVQPVQRWVVDSSTGQKRSETVGAVGLSIETVPPAPLTYNPLAAVPATFAFTGNLMVQTVHSMAQMPSKVVDLWHAVTGGQRDMDTPVSVVGASRIGGEVAQHGLWGMFILLLAILNFFLGAFNLLPLLPLDGGHMAITLYEKIRNSLRAWRGLPPGMPVNYLKLMPATYVVIVIGGAYMLLTVTADIVNPIRLFQ
ncbi:site-2 protease family protein [Skermania sp. ID1734]|uniref:M50 family metallopeptidase n=1 Tax=Skermania sp. ID1734 TaxID=2597516 RepID=UPI00117CB1E5|nr:site-2 protease family protein [Skermania sp. ID1734]TSD93536.1 site-2 protease family protein [Skermania sp. ID1734]